MAARPQRVFISHIHEEQALGAVVKDWIEDAFSGNGVMAFLSSDRRDLPAGRRWLDVVREELNSARVLVSLLSPISIQRPWVNIELGAGWSSGLAVIPLCHSGLAVGTLPRPFGDFNGIGLDQADAAERLLGGVADGLNLQHPRRLQFAQCLNELRAAATVAAAPPAAQVQQQAGALDNLPPQQVSILRTLAEATNRGFDHVDESSLRQETAIPPATFRFHIDQLETQGFVGALYDLDGTHYSLTPDGSGWLIEAGQMPD